jgi:hypothetical protein
MDTMLKKLRVLFFLFLAATVVCTLFAFAVLAKPVQAGGDAVTVKSSVDLRIELPNVWPWNQNGGSDAVVVPVVHDAGS